MNLAANAHYRVLTFEHANLKRPLQLVAGTLIGYHWSEAAKAVLIYTAGGATFPVTGSIEEVTEKINQLSKGEQ